MLETFKAYYYILYALHTQCDDIFGEKLNVQITNVLLIVKLITLIVI